MKKALLSVAFVFATFISAEAQVFQSDNFNSYTVGDLGTDITGETTGQGGWLTWTSGEGGANSDFQIIEEGGTNANVLQIMGSPINENKFVWQDELDVAWTSRTEGNNILKVKADFFTGAPTNSVNSYRVMIYGRPSNDPEATPLVIAGFALNSGTKNLQGLCYLNNAGTLNTYLINFATGGLIADSNAWLDMEVIFNQTTGRVSWVSSGAEIDGYFDGAATGFDIVEVNIAVVGGTGNTVSTPFKIDNFVVGAVATEEDVLSNQQVEPIKFNISIYPNPANDVINIANAVDSIEKVTITDLNGRVVKTVVLGVNEAQINISDLSQGVYLLNATSNGASVTEKIVKK